MVVKSYICSIYRSHISITWNHKIDPTYTTTTTTADILDFKITVEVEFVDTNHIMHLNRILEHRGLKKVEYDLDSDQNHQLL